MDKDKEKKEIENEKNKKNEKIREKKNENENKVIEKENTTTMEKGKDKETEKRSFRKESKGISKRIVNLFYLEKEVNSWNIASDFNQIFDLRALQFVSYYWTRLHNSRKYYIIVLLLTLTTRNIIELNKKHDFKKLLNIIQKESNNIKFGLDRKFINNVLSILYNKLSVIKNDAISNEINTIEFKSIKYNINKLIKADKEWKCRCNSPLFAYINHNSEEEIKFKKSIKWKSNQNLPTEKERMNKYKKLNYFKNKNIDEFLKRKTIFEPTVIVKEKPNSFLRSGHNLPVSKSISVPTKVSKSMLSSNQNPVKKLVVLDRKEIENIEKEEKQRLQELKERKAEEKRRKKEEEKMKKKSKRKSVTSKSSKPSSPKELEKPSSSDFAIIIDDDDDEKPQIPAFSSPISISSDDYSPPMAGSSLFDDTSPILINETESIPSSPIKSPIRSSSPLPTRPLLLESPQNMIAPLTSSSIPISSSLNNISNQFMVTNEIKTHDYLDSVVKIDNSYNIKFNDFVPTDYLWEKDSSNVNKMLNTNWVSEETNKIINKYFEINENDYGEIDNMEIDNDNEFSNSEYKCYNNNIYLRIYNHYKKTPKEQQESPLNFKFNYFPSSKEKYPSSIDIIKLTDKEKELLHKYKQY